MRLIVMHKNAPSTEAGEMPSTELIEQMGAFIGEHAQAGRFLGGEGLGASHKRTRITFKGGQPTIKHGPYAGANELPAGLMLITVKTREEAIGWAERWGKIVGDGELELGPVTEAWDLGFGTRPADAPLRVLMVEKADATSEGGRERTPKQKSDLTRLRTEMSKAGVLVATEFLQPSSAGKRLTVSPKGTRVVDGPFSEAKELIGGFTILEVADFDEAIAICNRFGAILGGTQEIDLRPSAGHEP